MYPVISKGSCARLLRIMLTRSQAFKIIRTKDAKGEPIPFAVTFCTLDESRDTGGDIRTLKGLVPSGSSWNLERNLAFGVKRANGKDFSRGKPVITIHVPLLLRVNGQPVA